MRNRSRGIVLLGLLALLVPLLGHVTLAGDKAAATATELTAAPLHIKKAQLIGGLLAQHHYRTQQGEGSLSATVFDGYLDALDRERYYFLAEDIKAFEDHRQALERGFLRGEMSAPYRIFARYQKRVHERVEFAKQLLEDGFAFDADERIELDRSEAAWPTTREELDELWRKRVKHDALTLLMADQEPERVKEILSARYERVARVTREHSADDVFEIYMNAWARIFDPHTAYMSPRISENFDIHMRLSLEGIGAVLRSEHDMTEVMELVTGGPAQQSGEIQTGDRILAVGQDDNGELVDVVGWRLQDVVDLIRGPKESVVRLQVLPAGSDVPKVVTLVRNEIKLEEQAAQAKVQEIGSGDERQRIGVIKIPTFYMDFQAAEAGDRNYRSTTRDVRRLIAELEEEGVDGLVVDLRGNGGGSLREATELTGLFLPGAPVVQVRRSSGDVEVLRDSGGNAAYTGPVAVLVDRFSASASEIFAAAIQDHGRGVVIGQQTFGKGTVQNLIDLEHFGLRPNDTPMGRLKLTIAKFYRVNGGSTQLEGVLPDITLPSPVSLDEFGESAVSNALPWGSIEAVPHRRDAAIDDMLPKLRERHQARAEQNAAYQALTAEYEHLRRAQRRNSAPLSEQARRAERDALQAEQLEYVNRRREIYGLEPLETLETAKLDDMPDTLLEAAAAVVADLRQLRPQGSLDETLHARKAQQK